MTMIYHISDTYDGEVRFLGCCEGTAELAQFRREWRENDNRITSLIIREATENEFALWKELIGRKP